MGVHRYGEESQSLVTQLNRIQLLSSQIMQASTELLNQHPNCSRWDHAKVGVVAQTSALHPL